VNVPFLIARRYFRSKNKRNIITIISNISMIGVAVGTAALIIVLSVFNGLEDLVRTLYGKSDPNLVISAAQGKAFDVDRTFLMKLENTPGVALLTQVIEDNALLRYHDRQMVVKMRGLSNNYFGQSQIDANIREGDHRLHRDSLDIALIGAGVQHELSITLNNRLAPLRLLYPRNTVGRKTLSMNPEEALNQESLIAGGVFLIEQHIDDSYIFVPISFAQRLLGYTTRRTALFVKVGASFEIDQVKAQLRKQLGPSFKVQDSDEQHVSLFKAIKVEKLFVFITFTLILLIASLNIFFSLSMLVIDKKKDISVLLAMGASQQMVRRTFLYVGAIVALVGAAVGLLMGVSLCWLQQRFGLVSMGMATSVVESYPVKMQVSDIVFTCVSIVFITLAVSIRPALNAGNLDLRENL
jgi:lipoprotein-releasing system permease protein